MVHPIFAWRLPLGVLRFEIGVLIANPDDRISLSDGSWLMRRSLSRWENAQRFSDSNNALGNTLQRGNTQPMRKSLVVLLTLVLVPGANNRRNGTPLIKHLLLSEQARVLSSVVVHGRQRHHQSLVFLW